MPDRSDFFKTIGVSIPIFASLVVIIYSLKLYSPCTGLSNHYNDVQSCWIWHWCPPSPTFIINLEARWRQFEEAGVGGLWQQIVFPFGQKALPRQRALCCPPLQEWLSLSNCRGNSSAAHPCQNRDLQTERPVGCGLVLSDSPAEL